MATPTIEAVVAGSRGFALALMAPLTERIGTRPRIATDPSQALAYCSEPGLLVVVEFLGADTMRGIKDLVLQGNGARIVAAIGEAHGAAETPLRALGVDVAKWDGKPGEILAAVGRQLAGPPAPPSRAAGPPTPAPAAQRSPAPAGVAPGAAPPPGRPPPAQAPPVAPRAASAGPPVAPRAAPPVAASAASAAAPAAGPTGTALFGAVEAEPGPAAAVSHGAPLAPARAWPSNVPGQAEAADALARAFAGAVPPAGSPLAVAGDVVATLSDIERAVLAGNPQPVAAEPIRRAAAMRVRVGAALATVPSQGGEVDGAAVSAFLAEIDALLSEVNGLAAGAPPEVLPSLESVRNALVREAIDLSEAVQRASPPGAPVPVAPAARPAPNRPQARLLSIEAGPAKAPRGGVAKWIALAVAVALAAGYHGWSWYHRRATRAVHRAGLPAGFTEAPAPAGAPRILVPAGADEIFDAAEVARFRAVEEAKGNVVRESGGMIFITPAPPAPVPAAAPPKP
jgi:hypothetical protein